MSKIDNIIEAIEELKIDLISNPQYMTYCKPMLCVMNEQLVHMEDKAKFFKSLEESQVKE